MQFILCTSSVHTLYISDTRTQNVYHMQKPVNPNHKGKNVMKSRNQIYKGEGESLLRLITTYHALQYEQVLQFFTRNRDSIKSLITSLSKQGRIYHDKDRNLLCDALEAANSPDYGMIAAIWVLLDFKKAVVYHTSGEFPVKLHFFSQDEVYEVIYVGLEQEALINYVMGRLPANDSNRLVILESEQQAKMLSIDRVIAYCLVSPDGTVNYYQKQQK